MDVVRAWPTAGVARAVVLTGVPVAVLTAVSVELGGVSWGPLTRDSLPVLTAGLSFAASGYAAVRRRGAMRRSWALLAAMILLNALGAAQWLADGGSHSQRTLSLTDVLYLAALVPGVLGLVLYPMTTGLYRTWRPFIVDGLVLGSSLLLLGAVLALSEVGTAVHGTRAFMLIVYPTTDLLIISLVVVVLLRSSGQPRPDVLLLAVTFVGFGAGDFGFALDGARGAQVGPFSQLGYVGAGLALSLAALCAATLDSDLRELQHDLRGLVAPVLPDVAGAVAIGTCLALGIVDDVQAVLAASVVILTTLRRLGLTWHNLRLRHDLEDRVATRTEELQQLTAEHERLDAMKREFVSAVSHELRTPLTAIRGALELLADGDAGELPPHARPVVEMAARGSQRLSRLVNDIIDLERLESGTFGIDPRPAHLLFLVFEAVAPLESLARGAGVELRVDQNDAWALCDGDRVTQAIVNLVGNAIKFTPSGGVVTVAVTGGPSEVGDGYVQLSVSDTGRGIPESELSAIFERFHQVDPDDARTHAGTGLGLPITRRIVEAHGGTIRVESTVGVGSAFHLTLPAALRPLDLSRDLPSLAPDPNAPEPATVG